MGPQKSKCDRLQTMIGPLKSGLLILAVFVFWAANAQAQIIPLRGTLVYSANNHEWPSITVSAENGSRAYTLTLTPDSESSEGVSYIDLVLLRPHAKLDTPNLLEPDYTWHGLQEYMFNASDFVHGPENSIFGTTRHLHIKRRKLDVTFSIAKVKIRPVEKYMPPDGYVFDELVINVSVDNAK